MAAPFRLYSTRSRQVEPFEPIEAGKVRLYVCGMTVYDDAHLGHARVFAVMDTFVRYLRHRGWEVTYVRNFTDVDDKIIRRANETGEAPIAVADRYVERFREDMIALGLAPPEREPRVTQCIPDILEMIAKLVEGGHAYADAGSVWFSVPSWPAYGELSNQQVAELRSEDPDSGKRHPADFALWKAAKPGEPSWESPWGPGRPGWHIECSAMAASTFGPRIDIHGGGLDLVFPHHENEIAQSECAHGQTFARYWMHGGLLTVWVEEGGERRQVKMSHSLKNFVVIRSLVTRYPTEALRLYYLQHHYRSPLPFDADALDEALAMLGRLYDAREVAERMGGEEDAAKVVHALGADAEKVHELGQRLPELLYQALDDDFNTAMALGHAFELARAINRLSNHKQAAKRAGPVVAPALQSLRLVADALGLLTLSTADFQAEVKAKRLPCLGITADQVDGLIAQRAEARAAKDWARADGIRDQLEASQIAVMDRVGGASEWRVRLAAPER
ncbi:MAG: cysteine--tRNA ligase [Myxococcota bacterium]